MKRTFGPRTWLYPQPAVLVGALVDGAPNYCAIAWCGQAASRPPALTVALTPVRYTLRGIVEHKTFSVNIASAALAREVDAYGLVSGADHDKAGHLESFFGKLGTAPMLVCCPASLECRVHSIVEVGSHRLVIGEIVETHFSEEVLTDGNPDPAKIDPLAYCSSDSSYYRMGERVSRAFKIGEGLIKRRTA